MKKNFSAGLLIGVTLLIIFVCIIVFIRPAISPWLDLSKSGQIGDTIGGIAAPIVGILGAVLVYLSFKEQLEANRIQRIALNSEIERSNAIKEMDVFLRIYNQLEESFMNLTYFEYRGSEALDAYIENRNNKDLYTQKGDNPGFENSIDHIINLSILILRRNLLSNLPENEDELIKQMLVNFYNNRLSRFISNEISGKQDSYKKLYKTIGNLWKEMLDDMEIRGYYI